VWGGDKELLKDVLGKKRGKLNAEIKVALIRVSACPEDDFFRGRLRGLLWVRDGLLYNVKEIKNF